MAADPRTRRITGDGWSLRADRVEVAGGSWRALVGVCRGLKLLVTWDGPGQQLEVEAWAAEPEESDGSPLSTWVRVTSGWRGCPCAPAGTAVRQRGRPAGQAAARHDLPALVALLRDLPWTHTSPTRENVLRGRELAALEERENGDPPGRDLFAPGTSESFLLP